MKSAEPNLGSSEARDELQRIGRVFHLRRRLPEYVFRNQPLDWAFLDSGWIVTSRFFEAMQEWRADAQVDTWILGVIEPDPFDYYLRHFGTIPWFRFHEEDSSAEYLKSLHADPGGSPADSAATSMEVAVIYLDDLRLAMYADQYLEVTLVGMMDPSVMNTVRNSTLGQELLSSREALDLARLARGQPLPQGFEKQWLERYPDRSQ